MTSPTGPLTPTQWQALQQLLGGATAEQLSWMSGYLSGYVTGRQTEPKTDSQPADQPEITVLYGSQTGNAARLADSLHELLGKRGVPARLIAMDAYRDSQLKQERILAVIVSTYGEGEPPDNAQGFYEFLFSRKAPKLEGLRFCVLGLGDTSYEYFCKTGRDIDGRLEILGAQRLLARVDCDVDFEEAAESWMEKLLSELAVSGDIDRGTGLVRAESTPAYSKANPYPAKLLANILLSGRGSGKEVRHLEFSLENSGLHYEPGDSLGVKPVNWPMRVAEITECLKLDPGVAAGGGETTLEQALLQDYEITTLSRPFLEKWAQFSNSGELAELLKEENRAKLREFCHGREIIDVLRSYPVAGIGADLFLGSLRRLQPRQYSIASSLKANPEEAHLTVAVVRYDSLGLERQGVASVYLAERAGEVVKVHVERNPNFKLPANPEAPVIMVGPGTGIAPFRAFIQEREAIGAKGRNWLFFGDRNFLTDFLYQREWLEYRRRGLLERIDVAFSRDVAEKVYVQHRLLENAKLLYAWLEEGAYFYVCGDAQRMAPDVHQAIIAVVEKEGGRSPEQAAEYVKALQADKRYQRDIY